MRVKPKLTESAQLVAGHEPRVGLDRAFGARVDAEGVLQPSEELLDLPVGQEVGGAATPVHLHHARTLADGGAEHLELPVQPREIAVDDLGARGDGGVAAAVEHFEAQNGRCTYSASGASVVPSTPRCPAHAS
jgi:hypothetical protein